MDQENQKNPPPKHTAFQKALSQHRDAEIRPDTQSMLNKPMATKMSEVDHEFLDMVIAKIEKGEINLYTPQSLLNKDIYASLAPEKEQKVDLTLQSLLFELRQIKNWHDAGENENAQMDNMIRDVRIKKENLEKEVGDVLKI